MLTRQFGGRFSPDSKMIVPPRPSNEVEALLHHAESERKWFIEAKTDDDEWQRTYINLLSAIGIYHVTGHVEHLAHAITEIETARKLISLRAQLKEAFGR